MRIRLTAIASLLLLCIPVQAQELELGGYLEHQVYPQKLAGSTIVMDYSKLRLDVRLSPAEWWSLTGDAIAQRQHGKRRFNSFDYIPERVVGEYAGRVNTPYEELRSDFGFDLEDELFVDNAFATIYAGNLTFRVGRQQLPWGTGYAWNPSDVFHDKNQLDPTYEKRGVDAGKIEIPFAGMGLITAVVELDKWNRAKKALRIKHHVKGFDVSISGIETYENITNYETFETDHTRRRLLAGDFSGTMGGIGVWFEGTYSDPHIGDSYTQTLIGVDYTSEAGLYFMAEYYHNGNGARNRRDFDFERWMHFLGAAGENLGRDYLFAGHMFALSDLMTGSNYTIVSLTDGSAVVYPYFEYSLSDNAVLTLIGYVTLGKADSEFGAFGSGLILRGRLYF